MVAVVAELSIVAPCTRQVPTKPALAVAVVAVTVEFEIVLGPEVIPPVALAVAAGDVAAKSGVVSVMGTLSEQSAEPATIAPATASPNPGFSTNLSPFVVIGLLS
jgi:hypothetical protein